jgi:Prokaryotic membrane lipoprotein lipid attachment site
VRRSLLALGATLLLAGCGGDVDPGRTPAGLAQVHFLDNLYKGRLDPVYASLHPVYQRLVPRKRFVACTRAAALGGLDSIEILDVYNDPVDLPGTGRVPAKAVRVRLTSSDGEATTFVNHEVKVGPSWRWVLNAAAARAYRAGRCPSG